MSKLIIVLTLIFGISSHLCMSQVNDQMLNELNEVFTEFKPKIKVEFGDLEFKKIDKVGSLEIDGLSHYYPNSKFYIADVRVDQFGMPIVLECVVKKDIDAVFVFINIENPESKSFVESLGFATILNDQMENFGKCIFKLISSTLIETLPQDCEDCSYSSSKLITELKENEVKVSEVVDLKSSSGNSHSNWINRNIYLVFKDQHLSAIKQQEYSR